ncbi:MAG: ribosome-associated translation inhibitor RaiA [Legionella sp.]|jgi:putative sigma-54 modulation protein|nr:ribosome-associated translation inhibitor RaiA [Legionella sp.]
MEINFTGHQIDVTPALKAFTEEKLGKLERHFDRIKAIHVTFNVEKLRQIVDATVDIARGDVHARSESDNMYTSIDDLVGKLDRQLIKHKEKMMNHRE